jgi:hypothetical protein
MYHRYLQYLVWTCTHHKRLIILEHVFTFSYGYKDIGSEILITLPFTYYQDISPSDEYWSLRRTGTRTERRWRWSCLFTFEEKKISTAATEESVLESKRSILFGLYGERRHLYHEHRDVCRRFLDNTEIWVKGQLSAPNGKLSIWAHIAQNNFWIHVYINL